MKSEVAALAAECFVSSMLFDKRLHEGIRRGEITCSVRIWIQPRVKVGGRTGSATAKSKSMAFRP